MRPPLTIPTLREEARRFAEVETTFPEPTLYGVTDGKAIGTYIEHKFQAYLRTKYQFIQGSSAKGIDFPELEVDLKVTSINQPQSSCPFKSARQKVFGLGYSLLVFVYSKTDDLQSTTATLDIRHTLFVEPHRTGDYQMTRGIRQILENEGNQEDLVAFMMDRLLPVDEVEAHAIARDLLAGPLPDQGYLTISNALQWRLQYGRAIEQAGSADGVLRIR